MDDAGQNIQILLMVLRSIERPYGNAFFEFCQGAYDCFTFAEGLRDFLFA